MVQIILWLLGNSCDRGLFNSHNHRTADVEVSSSDLAGHDGIDSNPIHHNDAVLSAGVAHPEEEYQGSKGYLL